MAWDDPAWDAKDFDAVVVGPTWDYIREPDAFLARLDGAAKAAPVFNDAELIRWNADKRYLDELEAEGVPTVPTHWEDVVDQAALDRAFEAFETEELVVKPVVGAGAEGQYKVRRGDPVPVMRGASMVQPYLRSIEQTGELSVIVVDREVSHVLRKLPKRGDYRVQSMFGGREEVLSLTDEVDAFVKRVLGKVRGGLLLARVDLVRGEDGGLRLIELELIEPYLYPVQGPRVGEHIAAALDRALRGVGLRKVG